MGFAFFKHPQNSKGKYTLGNMHSNYTKRRSMKVSALDTCIFSSFLAQVATDLKYKIESFFTLEAF
jgi:hypothetical protein